MIIVNQDRDERYLLDSSDIFYKRKYTWRGLRRMFMGYNLYGRTADDDKVLLGTFDTDFACKTIIWDIERQEAAGKIDTYSIPEEADDLDDLAEYNDARGCGHV